MKDKLQIARDMDIFGDIMVVKFKISLRKKVFYIGNGARQEVVHPDHMKAFFQEAIAKVRPNESGRAGD